MTVKNGKIEMEKTEAKKFKNLESQNQRQPINEAAKRGVCSQTLKNSLNSNLNKLFSSILFSVNFL